MTRPILETNIGRIHTKRCLAVQRYGSMSHYVPKDEVPKEDTPSSTFDCSLCELGLTDEQQRYAPRAAVLLEHYYTDSPLTNKAILDGLRHLITRCGDRLRDTPHLAEKTGISVKSSGHWRSARSDTARCDRFDELLSDGLGVCFIFDLAYISLPEGANCWDSILSKAVDGDFGRTPEKNVAKSLQWLEQYQEPTAKTAVNDVLSQIDQPTCTGTVGNSEGTVEQSGTITTEPGDSGETQRSDTQSQIGSWSG